jgi:all-trans-retinol 13,14-reductase
MRFDVVIIGSGLGGLLCGNILSKEGYSVCILEKNNKLGGSLQTFGRKGCIFNTGLNYTESLDDGQVLNQYFRYFGLHQKFPLKRLDENGFDVISFHDGTYKLAMGHENYRDTLLQYFPKEKQGLTQYIEKIRDICSSISLYTFSEQSFNIFEIVSLGTGAADFIQSVISDNRLQNVIAGNNLMYAGHRKKTPLFVHALINNSFIESAWRVTDGSHHLVNTLADNIITHGGTILKNAKAEKFISENDVIKAVEISSDERIEGKYFISNTHPEQILSMTSSPKIRSLFSYRIRSLEDTIGMFTVYIIFKKNTFPYLNYNFYHHQQDNVWIAGEYDASKWPQTYVFMPTATSKTDYYAESASLLTYMQYNELEPWKDTLTGNRGEDYIRFKNDRTRKLLDALEKQFPGIMSCIDTCYSSTPLTWRDFTGTRGGSAYGVLKDFNRPLESFIMSRTKISNLFLTGQNTNVHGILGVTISSVITCGEIIDIRYLVNKIRIA